MNADHRKENIRKIKEMVRSATPQARRKSFIQWFFPARHQIDRQARSKVRDTLRELKREMKKSPSSPWLLFYLEKLEKYKLKLKRVTDGKSGGRPVDYESEDVVYRIKRLKSGDQMLTMEEIYQEVSSSTGKSVSAVKKNWQRHNKKL
jgi:hypothetical protein